MKKLRASSLQLVTFIIVVITLLLSSFIILMHVHKQFRLQSDHTIELVRLSDLGIQHCLTKANQIQDTLAIELYDEDYKSLKVTKSFWGVFEKAYAISEIKNKRFYKIALIGGMERDEKTALFLKDNARPLVVVGHTKIEGYSYLPKRGIKSGNISGQSYYGSGFVNGKTELSSGFPKLSDELRQHIKSLNTPNFQNTSSFEYLDIKSKKKISNSFNNSPLIAYSNKAITLSENELTGHIIIKSDIKITVDDSSKLTDVILVAPHIEIEENVKGSFQALASETITVSKNVTLEYPSALIINGDYIKREETQEHYIEIKSNSKIKGSILCLGKTAADNYDVQLKINHNVGIEGEVYCEQNMELRGSVYGSVYANNFIVKEGGTTYQNHLYNGEININKLTEEYAGLTLGGSAKSVMKWLY